MTIEEILNPPQNLGLKEFNKIQTYYLLFSYSFQITIDVGHPAEHEPL